MLLDYATLKVIWWALLGVLLIGFALTDGFDMGVGTLLPFVGRNDGERRVIINSIGPTWEGNQVWFVTAGGATFAAWPLVYATAFSGFYVALLLVLFALFFRPVGFDYRSKIADTRWRSAWDWALFAGGTVPALVFGVAFGNLLLGVPFQFDTDLRVSYTGSFWALLNPFALLCGLVSLAMLVMHGAAFLRVKTEGDIQRRASICLRIATHVAGFYISSAPAFDGVSNPLLKSVETAPGAWLANYTTYPWTRLAPAGGFAGALLATALARTSAPPKYPVLAFLASGLSVTGIILTAGLSMFPFILPSTILVG